MIHKRTLNSLEFDKVVAAIASHCVSDPGRSLTAAIAPLAQQKEACEAMALYEETATWASATQFTVPAFPDTAGIIRHVEKKRGPAGLPAGFSLDPEALWALREMLRLAQKAAASITDQPTGWPRLHEKVEAAHFPAELLAGLNRCLSDDGLLRDESSPELFQVRSDLRSLHQSCLRKVRDYAQKYNMLPFLQDEFMTLSSDRYVLPLKANFKGRMQGIIHDWSQTGETCYFEPYFLVDVNNRLQELKRAEREEERKVLIYLTGLAESQIEGAAGAAELLAWLDMQQAIRRFARQVGGECVTFTDPDAGIGLFEARHPLLILARSGRAAQEPVRPLDIELRSGERALIVTGGNAGGKTVCLKTLGLLSVMAMAGLPVPARKGSNLPWFERIDAFIGDEQSLADNVSTFSAQIDHLAKAFRHLNRASLALLDEFGAGTDPAEGAALAQAVHDELLEKECFVLSATHFPGLKAYALTKEGARAASMLFDPQTSRPLFRLAYDQVGSSQALAVAAEHGLPESILSRARHYLLQDGEDTDAILARLNDLACQREQELAALKKREAEINTGLADKKEKLERERKRLHDLASDKISEIMAAWKNGKSSAKQTMKEMSGLRAELGLPERKAESVLPQAGAIGVGQQVFHAAFNKRGTITDADPGRDRFRVNINGVSVWARASDLRLAESSGKPEKPQAAAVPARGPAFSIDVRGQRAAEALAEVERFLDQALPGGASEVEIIHGRGTGALRREIHAFLRSFPGVEGIRLAPEDRGGDGMTIVSLK